MLRVNLMDLDRAGTRRIQGELAVTDPVWGDTHLRLAGPVDVDLQVTATPTGQVVARGTIRATLDGRCRRCLTELQVDVEQEVAMVWAPRDTLGGESDVDAPRDEDEVRELDAATNELDLAEAVREEMVLAAPTYILCDDECQGLCPRCGINRNEDSCDCTMAEPDPRWDALRALKQD